MATKDSNNFVTFDHQIHGSCAATEGDTACAQYIATWKNAHDFSFIPLLTKPAKSEIVEIITTSS
jgi:hypothetical protein